MKRLIHPVSCMVIPQNKLIIKILHLKIKNAFAEIYTFEELECENGGAYNRSRFINPQRERDWQNEHIQQSNLQALCGSCHKREHEKGE